MLTASIIIPTMDRETELINCLNSICQQTYLPLEIFVVDASEKNILKHQLTQTFPALPSDLIYLRAAPSTTRQRNLAAQQAKGDIFIFLDDDVILEQNFVTEMMRPFNDMSIPNLGGVTGRITNATSPDWRGLLLSRIFGLSEPGEGCYKKSGFPTHRSLHPDQTNLAPVQSIPSSIAAFRREVFAQFVFDETMSGYAYMEDDDFSLRVGKRYQLVYNPHARLEHLETPTARGNPRHRARQRIRCYGYYFRKNWPNTLTHRLAYYWALVGLTIAGLLSQKGQGWSKFLGALEGIIDIGQGDIP